MCTWLLQVFITCFSFLATITISDVVLITISLDNEGKAYFIMAMSAAGLLFSMVKFCLKKRKMNHVEEEKLKYEVELAKVTKERQELRKEIDTNWQNMHDPGYGDEHPRCWQSKEEAEEYYFGGKLDYGVDYDLQKKKHVRFIKDISKSYSAEGGFKQALIGSTMFITAYKAIFIQLVDSVFDIIVAVSFLVNIEYGTSSSFLLLAATWIGFSEEAVELFFEFTWCVMTCCAEKCIHGIILLAVLEFFGCVLELGFGIYLSIQILDNDDTFLFAIIICIVQGIMILIVLIACCFSNKYFKQSLSLNKEANLDKFADTSLPYIYTWEVQIEERKIWDSNTDVIKIGIGQYGKSVNYDENTDYNYGFLHKMEGVCKQNTYRYFCGQKYTDPMSGEGANVEWADGDMIRMELDVLNKTLKAYRNGYSLGEAIPDVEVGEGIKYYCMAEEQQYNSYQYKNKPTTKVNIVSFVKYSSE